MNDDDDDDDIDEDGEQMLDAPENVNNGESEYQLHSK